MGSSRLENVVAFQNVRKLATSRLITPAIAAGSIAAFGVSALWGARSLGLLAGEQDEDVTPATAAGSMRRIRRVLVVAGALIRLPRR